MTESVQVALIVGGFGFLGSLALAWLTGQQRSHEATQAAKIRAADKQEDWDRQDEVAEQVRQVAKATAENDSATADALKTLHDGQVQIHELVNSNLTASIQDAHDSTVLLLAALNENIAEKRERGIVPTAATMLALSLAETKITEYESQLRDRAKVQEVVEQQAAASLSGAPPAGP